LDRGGYGGIESRLGGFSQSLIESFNNWLVMRFARGILILIAVFGVAYLVWNPGLSIINGRHDLGRNGIWLGHGWLGNDIWFVENARDKTKFRSRYAILKLKQELDTHGIRDLFPHLTPTGIDGKIPTVDEAQTKLFLELLPNKRVMPWLGGVTGKTVFLESPTWRKTFVSSVKTLLETYPHFAGVHLDFEPLHNHDEGFLKLLLELRAVIGAGKLISLATPKPNIIPGIAPDWFWDKSMFLEVSRLADQIVPMLYDTSISLQKPYIALIETWTRDVLLSSNGKEVLLGVPAWDEPSISHHPDIENITNSLRGIQAALEPEMPKNYAGIALYAHFTFDDSRWKILEQEFTRSR
jgi:Glycosyl hydrolases family 18